MQNIEIPNYENRSPVIAHYNPSQYTATVMNKVPSKVHTLPHYATRIILILLPSSQWRELFIIMDIIIRSTSDMCPYLYHHYTVELKLTLMESFTFTEYLFMEQRYIRILPKSGITRLGHVQMLVNSLHPLPQINIGLGCQHICEASVRLNCYSYRTECYSGIRVSWAPPPPPPPPSLPLSYFKFDELITERDNGGGGGAGYLVHVFKSLSYPWPLYVRIVSFFIFTQCLTYSTPYEHSALIISDRHRPP